MAFVGNTKTYGLTNVLNFIASSRYSGKLRIYFKKLRIDLFLLQGQLAIPLNQNWKPIFLQDELKTENLASGTPPENLRTQVEEAIYEIFFKGDANYIFDRDEVPELLQNANQTDIWFMKIPTDSLLMEASRRLDDFERAQNAIQSTNNLFYATCDSSQEEPDQAKLLSYINGARNLHEIVQDSGFSLYHVVTSLEKFIQEKKVKILEPEKYLHTLQKFIQEKDYHSAFCLYKHLLLENNVDLEQLGQILFQNSEILTSPHLHHIQGKIKGNQALCLVYDFLKYASNVALQLKSHYTRTLILKKDRLIFKKGIQFLRNLLLTCVDRKIFSKDEIKPWKSILLLSEENFRPNSLIQKGLSGAVLLIATFLEELGLLSLEENLDIHTLPLTELSEEEEKDCLSFPLTEETRKIILQFILEWKEIQQNTLEHQHIVVLVRPARKKYVETNFPIIGDFLRYFHRNRNRIDEVRQKMGRQVGTVEFYAKLLYHLKQNDLRILQPKELKELVCAEMMIENYITAIRMIEAGKIQDPNDLFFQRKLEEIRLLSEESIVADDDRLIGDLASFSLAEVLQNLINNQLTGTLRITIPNSKKEMYFDRGDIFLLKEEEEASETTVSTFLDTEALNSLSEVAESQELDLEELAEIARQEIYELFLWEGASFTFILDALPEKYYNPQENVIKLSLDSQIFLMQAMDILDMWEEISKVITTEKVIFRFTSEESKLQALAMGKNPHIIYMIDGFHNVEDLIRISNMGKLETCSFLFYDLYMAGLAVPLDYRELIIKGQEAYKKRDFTTALKYYEYALKLDPKNERLQKITSGLQKLVNQNQKN
ncbi:MAG: DUF4388 domain-containing protein [Planctomycetota bacterium]|nr:MAG: DUF4388 domain-containing protein [Planctomycetota bacterium]